MTAGLPGTGIGGMFYLLSALAMPVQQAYLAARGRRGPAGWAAVLAQAGIAGGIIAGMWFAGWVIGLLVNAPQGVVLGGGSVAAANVVRISMLVASLVTLAVVVGGVEVARLVVRRRRAPALAAELVEPVAPPARKRRRRRRVVLVLAALILNPQAAVAAHADPLTRLLARADSAWNAGDAVTAAKEYAAVLQVDPWNSRATYRLAQLKQREPAEALRLFRRYVELERADPWGYVAVAQLLARIGRYEAALRWYDAAGRLTPAERDVVIGRARVLRKAGRVNAAIAAYHSWLAVHAADAEARQEVAPLRAAAAAAVSAHVGGTGDSDGNSSIRAGVVAESPLLGPVRLGVAAGREEVHDAAYTARLRQLHVRSTWQLGPRLRIESALGATFADQLAAPAETTLFPTTPGRGRGAADRSRALASGQIRARWRNPAGSALLDLRGQHGLLSATPRLLASEVKRSEVRALVQVPALRPIALRGMGRAARLSALEGINYRTGVGGGVAVLGPAGELSATVHEIRYARPSAAPYASPRLAQLVEAGSYLEFERGAWTVALDIGAGVQRRADHGASLGKWVRALRAYALAIAQLAPGREVRLEIEAEDSPLSNEAAVGAGWRYASATLALRWAIH